MSHPTCSLVLCSCSICNDSQTTTPGFYILMKPLVNVPLQSRVLTRPSSLRSTPVEVFSRSSIIDKSQPQVLRSSTFVGLFRVPLYSVVFDIKYNLRHLVHSLFLQLHQFTVSRPFYSDHTRRT